MFSKMDPYAIIKLRDAEYRSKTLKNAGKLPKWNETFVINVKYIGDDMTMHIFDEDVTSSDLIGEVTFKISALCITGGLNDWFNISYKGKKSGSIHLKSEWIPDEAPKAEAKQPAQQQFGVNQAMNLLGGAMIGQPIQPMGMPQGMMYGQQPMGMQQQPMGMQ